MNKLITASRDAKTTCGSLTDLDRYYVGPQAAQGCSQLLYSLPQAVLGSNASTQDGIARLLKQSFGPLLVIAMGLIVLGVACFLFYTAYSARFQRQFRLATLPPQMKKGVIAVGRCGYAAMGVATGIIGIFLIVAGVQHKASEAKGLDGVLQELAHQSSGLVLLGMVALGLFAYGIYSLVEARYQRIGKA